MKELNQLQQARERTRLLLWGEYRQLDEALGELQALVTALPRGPRKRTRRQESFPREKDDRGAVPTAEPA
jgi:hypothetical protein